MSDSNETGGFDRRFKVALIFIGVVLAVAGPAAFVVAEDLLGSFWQSESGIHLNATGGPEVVTTKDYAIQSGNPFTEKSVNLSTQNNGWINVSTGDSDTGDMIVTIDQINGTTTNVSSVSASNGQIILDPDDKNESAVGGSVPSYKFFGNMAPGDGSVDFIYSGTSAPSVTVRGDFSDGVQYGAVDADTDAGLDVGVANANGEVTFDDLDTGTHDIVVQELGTLEIREEMPPHDKITSATAEIIFYETIDDDPTIINRSTSNGEIDLTGLPVNEEFAVTVSAAGYHNRTVIIDDLSQQETAFLLHKNVSSVEVEFQIDDQTGDFGDDAQIIVEKAIDENLYGAGSGFSWLTVGGDEVGAQNQFNIDLEEDGRYRLTVRDDEQTRILGSHTATNSQVVTLTIQDVTITIENESADILVGFEKDEENNQVEFLYNDTRGGTTDLEVVIYERGNESNEIHNETHGGPFGELFVEETVPTNQINSSWVVEYGGDRDGETIDGTLLTGDRGDPGTGIDGWIKNFASVFAILLAPTLFGGERAATGALVAVMVAGVLWWLQFTPPEISILSIMLAGTIAIGFKMRKRDPRNIA